jgi:uncharacterized membrane protein YdbT with pleckstrin-like domain
MYEAGKSALLRLLRVPHDPAPPEGSAGSLRTFRASPGYYKYRLLGWALRGLWLLVVAFIAFGGMTAALAGGDMPSGARLIIAILELFGLVSLVVGMIGSFLLLRLDYEMRWYMVTDRSLRIREGVWHVHEMTMTFANIQNISISQGPLQRLFGIADVRVQSAGGGGMAAAQAQQHQRGLRDLHVGFFRGVDDAQMIRDLVLHRLKALRDAGLGDHDDLRASIPRQDAHPPRVVAAGTSEAMLDALRALATESALLRRAVGAPPR